MKSTIVPVVDDVGGAQESVAENGHLVIGNGAEDTGVVVGLLPDEVVVCDVDGGIAKLEVERALGVGDGAVDDVLSARLHLGGGKGLQELVEGGSGQSAEGVARVEKESLGLGLHVELGAILLVDADAVAVGPVAGLAIGGRSGGDNVLLDEGSLELLGVNTTKDSSTA